MNLNRSEKSSLQARAAHETCLLLLLPLSVSPRLGEPCHMIERVEDFCPELALGEKATLDIVLGLSTVMGTIR